MHFFTTFGMLSKVFWIYYYYLHSIAITITFEFFK